MHKAKRKITGEGGRRVDLERQGRGMGWIPDYPDFRDYTGETLGNFGHY